MIDPLAVALAHVDFLPAGERAGLLTRWAERLHRDQEALARTITTATGKPLRLARLEVERGVRLIHATVEELPRLAPQSVNLGDGGTAEIHHQPAGPVLAITPFNFPLNLALHKIAPALLAGCPVLWQPSPKAAGVAEAALAHLLHAGADAGVVQLLSASHPQIAALAADPRLAVLSFTGSQPVGRTLQKAATQARVVLELGGNAAVIIHRNPQPADIARRIAHGACAHAGQVCISVQRIFVPAGEGHWRTALIEAFTQVPCGDPWMDATICGPLIDEQAVDRVRAEIAGAVARGGTILCGGTFTGRTLAPTLIAGLPAADPAVRDREVFAPIAYLLPYASIDEALTLADDTPFGLNAGIFTDDEMVIAAAFARIHVGTLVINDVPTRRDDRLPYGGVKASGIGREGSLAALKTYVIEKVLWRAG